jgi:hypothetical protein
MGEPGSSSASAHWRPVTQQPPLPPPGWAPPPPTGGVPPGQVPFGVQPPEKKSNTKLVLGIVGGVVAALLLCCGGLTAIGLASDDKEDVTAGAEKDAPTKSAGGLSTTPPASAKPSAPASTSTKPAKPTAQASPGLNDKVRDGKFEFTVTKMSCLKTQLGSSFLNKKAQGVFCIASVTVRNIGKGPQTFSGVAQKAYAADGSEYADDTAAEIYANSEAETFFNEINPGNRVAGKLVFDVPKGTTLTELELHDSLFSGGVRVKLS